MESLFELQKLLLDQFGAQPFYDRLVFSNMHLDNSVTGIVGMRGVGKTTFLLHTVLMHNKKKLTALYISADHVYFLKNNLLDLVSRLYKETDVHLLCIDEIHKYLNWQQELKNISDFYMDFKIIFSGSSMIDIIHSKFDLSRRVTLYRLHGLSFREYLEFTQHMTLPVISLSELLKKHEQLSHDIHIPQLFKHFKMHLEIGYFPFFKRFSQNLQVFQAIDHIVQKTIYEDIAILYDIKTPTLLVIEKLYKYIVHSQPGELSAYKLANALSKDYESISIYLHYLEQAGLIRALHKKQVGKAFLRNPIKMYPENTNFIYAGYLSQPQDMLIGKIRETFVLNQLQCANLSTYYSESGDFEVNNIIFEVGGKSKTHEQIKSQSNAFVIADGILVGSKNKLPLYLLGFIR